MNTWKGQWCPDWGKAAAGGASGKWGGVEASTFGILLEDKAEPNPVGFFLFLLTQLTVEEFPATIQDVSKGWSQPSDICWCRAPPVLWGTGKNVSLCNLQAFYKMFSPGKISGPLCIKRDIKFLPSTKGIMTATAGKEYVCMTITVEYLQKSSPQT